MTTKKNQNATQKLVELIRKQDYDEGSKKETQKPEPVLPQQALPLRGKGFPKGVSNKHLSLGVWIEPDALSLALVVNRGDIREVLQWRVLSIPEDQSPGTKEFIPFLAHELRLFLGKKKKDTRLVCP